MDGDIYRPPVLDCDSNRYINKTALDSLVPGVLSAVISWGCPKVATQSYLEFLKETIPPKKWTQYCNRWQEADMNKLQATDCSTFDTTFLNKLIPEVCTDIAKQGSKTWVEQDDTKIEYLITKLKDFRNDDDHEPEGAAISPTTIDSLKLIAIKVINASGKKYNVEQVKIQDMIDTLIKNIDKIKETIMTKKQRRMKKLQDLFFKEFLKEMEETVMLHAMDRLPFSKAVIRRSEVFHPPRFLMEKKQNNVQTECFFVPFEGLLNYVRDDSIIITGQPGSGKSTLSKTLREDFVLTKPKYFPGIKDYSVLILIDCGDQPLHSVPNLLRTTFPKTLQNVDDEAVIELFTTFNALIVVDGIDELSHQSYLILNELIDIFGTHGKSSFIFTSRPGATGNLMRSLSDKSLTYLTASIQPITEESEQIEFLKRYQANVDGISGLDLIEAFEKLEDPCKNCLIQPVYLSLFCHVFRSSPDAVAGWKNELGLMEYTRDLSMDYIKERLSVEEVTDKDEQRKLACKLMETLGNLTVGRLLNDNMKIDQKAYRRLCMYTFRDHYVNYYTILSCVLVGHSRQSSFQYVYKSQAEFLAARAIFRRLETEPEVSILDAISKIADEFRTSMYSKRDAVICSGASDAAMGGDVAKLSTEEACRFSNCFKFLIMMLIKGGSDKESMFKRCLKEVCKPLVDGGTPFTYWAELCLSCPTSREVAEAAAEAAMEVPSYLWRANTRRYMHAVTVMLQYHRPRALIVSTPEIGEVPCSLEPLLRAVAELYQGFLGLDMGHSYRSFTTIDHLLTHLYASRCSPLVLEGCVGGGSDSWQMLRAVWQRTLDMKPKISLSLVEPRLHQLDYLDGSPHILTVRVKTTAAETASVRRPLPRSKIVPPRLFVVCSSEEAGDDAAKGAALCEYLAPEDKMYNSIWVQNWKGSRCQLDFFVRTLCKAGLRTVGMGVPRWVPSATQRDGRCDTCGDVIHRPGERCVLIHIPQGDQRDVSERLEVGTPEQAVEVALQLPQRQSAWVEVWTNKTQQAGPILEPLMEPIRQWLQGSLDIRVFDSYRNYDPLDELLVSLNQAQCSLVILKGCLRGTSEQAWQGLVEASLRALQNGLRPNLTLSLLEPRQHMFSRLQGTPHLLVVRVRLHHAPGPRARCPLPTSLLRPPLLAVDCAVTGPMDEEDREELLASQATGLIEDLAPEDNRYIELIIQNWPGSDEALDKMVKDLYEANVRNKTTTPHWIPGGVDAVGNCMACQETTHRPGDRCVMLML